MKKTGQKWQIMHKNENRGNAMESNYMLARSDFTVQQREMYLYNKLSDRANFCISGTVTIFGISEINKLVRCVDSIIRNKHFVEKVFVNKKPDKKDYRDIFIVHSVALTDSEIEDMLCAEDSVSFDAEDDFLFKVIILVNKNKEIIIYQKYHHIIADGITISIVVREITNAYNATEIGDSWGFSVDGSDECDSRGEKSRQFWKDYTASLSDVRLLERVESVSGNDGHRIIPDEPVRRQLFEMIRENKLTFATCSIAFLIIYMHLVSRAGSVTIGLPVGGRTKHNRNAIGFFSNIIPLTINISELDCFNSIINKVRKELRRVHLHSRYRGEHILRSLGGNAKSFGPTATCIDMNVDLTYGLGRGIYNSRLSGPKADHDFTFYRINGGAAHDFAIIYAPPSGSDQQLDGRTLERSLQALLRKLVLKPDGVVGGLDILLPEERQKVLVSWNDTALSYPDTLCLHELIEQQVAMTPDAPAVSFEGHTLSYAELNIRANRLAHHLIALGIGPDMPVAVCLDRSPEMMIALLAILKAGGAYLPLDPS
ncbi:condensation domain-containing protein, partial [Asaia sp. HN010]|uniref:condensation domain-containing protein n=1 Tax=Asaia sp. HN010 TaxID=3081233 RepID=UPI00301A22D4